MTNGENRRKGLPKIYKKPEQVRNFSDDEEKQRGVVIEGPKVTGDE